MQGRNRSGHMHTYREFTANSNEGVFQTLIISVARIDELCTILRGRDPVS